MTLISQETLKELEETLPHSPKYVSCRTDVAKQLIHAAKVARVFHKLHRFIEHQRGCQIMFNNCTCDLSDILKELDELEKE